MRGPRTRQWLAIALVGWSIHAAAAASGPVQFGMDELNHALSARGLPTSTVQTELIRGEAESYRVSPNRITGGDERGLMYGLLQAAEDIETTGRIESAVGHPAVRLRGIRHLIHNEAMEKGWYYSKEYWNAYFTMLARNRFNRFNLVFAHQTNYLAPPYPFWVDLPEFPEIQVPGLSAEQRRKNLEGLCFISRAAADHGVDFTLGVWEHNAWGGMFPSSRIPSVTGITEKNIGPYSYAALKKVLQACPGIRSVQFRTNAESGIPDAQQVSFYRDWVYRAIREVGRPVILDLRGHVMRPGMLDAALQSGVPLRLSAKHWGEYMGRPYQPVEMRKDYSYLDLLRKSRTYDFFWEVWSLGSHRLLLWGDPEYVRRAVPTFSLSNSSGFELDEPLAQKGFGNGPETFGIFNQDKYGSQEEDRKFWKWEFERYWMFYRLWGRLSYDPHVSEDVWMNELRKRFVSAASDVLAAYQSASRVISEILAARSADFSQSTWPEIESGELISAYKDDVPSDTSFVATPTEAAHDVLHNVASAKQGPHETAQLLDSIAAQIDAAAARVTSKLGDRHKEWRGTEPDFQVLSHLARYHARKQEAAYSLSWFYETGSLTALDHAEANLVKALDIWKDLVRLTDGLYPNPMIYGPWEVGHWKDKLPYVYHDIAWIQELKRTQQKYGVYDFRFQFGAYAPPPDLGNDIESFLSRSSVEPRFILVHPESMYSEESGYGWYGGSIGSLGGSVAIHEQLPAAFLLESYMEMRALIPRPQNLPENVLFSSHLLIPEQANFRVRTGDATFEVVKLYPDSSETRETLTAHEGVVDVPFDQSREVTALLLRNLTKTSPSPAEERYPRSLTRPDILHTPPDGVTAGEVVKLAVKVTPGTNVTGIRLHYRPLNALEKIRTLEATGPSASFVIPAKDITGDFDLLYYFEVLNTEQRGWFQPDPLVATPYYVVTVQKPAR